MRYDTFILKSLVDRRSWKQVDAARCRQTCCTSCDIMPKRFQGAGRQGDLRAPPKDWSVGHPAPLQRSRAGMMSASWRQRSASREPSARVPLPWRAQSAPDAASAHCSAHPPLHAIFGKVRRHGLDDEIDEGLRSVQEELLVRVAAHGGFHPVRLRPSSKVLQHGPGRLAQERHL